MAIQRKLEEMQERYAIVSAYIHNQVDEAWDELRRRVIAKDASLIPDRFERLLLVADNDYEFEVIMRVALRAGLFWRCPNEDCDFDNDEPSSTCDECGASKPAPATAG